MSISMYEDIVEGIAEYNPEGYRAYQRFNELRTWLKNALEDPEYFKLKLCRRHRARK